MSSQTAPPLPPPSATICVKCMGARWLQVTPHYAERRYPWPERPPDGASPALLAAYEDLVAWTSERRAAASNSWFPCRVCNPVAFFRWVGHHWDIDHDTAGCSECDEIPGRRHHKRRSGKPDTRDFTEPDRDTSDF